jgi:GTP cyclohydrolase I
MQKKYIPWSEVLLLLSAIDKSENVVYGIPKGGMIAAGFLKKAQVTHNPEHANIILDDIVDSGRTFKSYKEKYPDKTFVSLFDQGIARGLGLSTPWYVFPWEKDHPAGEDSIQQNVIRQLQFIGEDTSREGLLDTPNRVVKSWGKLFEGYSKDPKDILTTFEANGYDEIVLLKDIEMYSMCEHHMLPFFGKAHVAYLPSDKVIGISKLARLVDIFARRLQIQERIGDQVTTAIMELLGARGAACIIEAQHMCMKMRGVEKQNSIMSTSSMKGVFIDNPAARAELLALIK